MRLANRPSNVASNPSSAAAPKSSKNTLGEIQRLQRERDERRKAMELCRNERAAEEMRNRENGNFGDVDYQRLVNRFREENAVTNPPLPHYQSSQSKICIAVRKRPINTKEVKKKDHDSVTCSNPVVIVHDCKYKVDGITKYLDSNAFEFDHTFHEDDSTDDVYCYCVQVTVLNPLSLARYFSCEILCNSRIAFSVNWHVPFSRSLSLSLSSKGAGALFSHVRQIS